MSFFRSQLAAKQVILGAVILSASAASAYAQGKTPIPDAAAQSQAEALVREIHAKASEAAKTPAERLALAQKLLDQASQIDDDPVGRFVLLRIGRDMAVQAGNIKTAFEAVDQMARTYEFDPTATKVDTLLRTAETARLPEQRKAVAEAAIPLIQAAVGQNDYEAANRLVVKALEVARKARDVALLKQIVAISKEVAESGQALNGSRAAPKHFTIHRSEIGRVVTRVIDAGNYHQYVPTPRNRQFQVLVVCHGTVGERETALMAAHTYIQRWIHVAEQFGLVLIAPAFERGKYEGSPGGWGYRALIGKATDADEFVIQIVDQYKLMGEAFDGKFYLYGHSAGGQFVNRFLVTHPDRIKAAVISAPSTYAFPNPNSRWPLGMKPLQRSFQWDDVTKTVDINPDPESWTTASRLPVTVVVGAADNQRQKERPNQGGSTRIERAQHWVNEMNNLAVRNGHKPKYRFVLVPGVGHSSNRLTNTCIQAFMHQ